MQLGGGSICVVWVCIPLGREFICTDMYIQYTVGDEWKVNNALGTLH